MQEAQKPQMNVVQEIQKEFSEQLMKKPYPVKNLSMKWRESAWKALRFASPFSLQISGAEFMKLVHMVPTDVLEDYHLSMFQFAVLSNNLEARSSNDLSLGLHEYAGLMVEAMGHVELYQKLVEDLKKVCEKKIADEHAMRKAAEKGVGKEPFKAIKGEA